MFSHDLTLKDFATPVAIYKAEANLGNILNVFDQTNANALVIPTGQNTWGIISSQKLLGFLAKSWQAQTTATKIFPRVLSDDDGESSIQTKAFNYLIEAVTVYQSDTKLTDFCDRLDDDFLSNRQDLYLIADSAGEIEGKLDFKRLIHYFGSRVNAHTVKSHLNGHSDPLLKSLNSISLPFKIETFDGKNVYLNKSWQELVDRPLGRDTVLDTASNISATHQSSLFEDGVISDSDRAYLHRSQSDSSVASWWIEQQLNRLQQNVSSDNHSNSTTSNRNSQQHCCLDDRYHLGYQSDLLSAEIASNSSVVKSERLSSTEHCSISSLVDNKNPKSAASYHNVHLELGTKWNYLRIPIVLDNQQTSKDRINQTSTPRHWLVLGIDSSTATEVQEVRDLFLKNYPITVDQVLATISHELKSPITGIMGLSSLLKAQTIGTLNQRQNHYVKLIYSGGHKLMNIVNDLLELTKLTKGTINLKPEPIDLESWCTQLYQQVLTKLESATVEESKSTIIFPRLKLDIESGLKTAIADRSRLSAIVSHLILETVKFADSTNVLAVSCKISRLDKQIAVVISNSTTQISSTSSASEFSSQKPDIELNINIVLARYLAKVIDGEINSIYRGDNCQFTLLLPQPDNLKLASESNQSLQIHQGKSPKNLTILCLYPESEVIDPQLANQKDLSFNLKHWVEQDWSDRVKQQVDYQHRIIEADGLEQAHTLARIWQLDALVLDGYQIANSDRYLRSLQKSEHLSALPLITLDTKTTQAANQIKGLNVYPCLLPAECRSVKDLMQVIQIATDQ